MNVFIESLKRLYSNGKLSTEKVIELFESGKISEQEKWEILNAH